MSHDDDKRSLPFDLLGGLGKLGEVVERLQEVAERAENLQRSGKIEGRDGDVRGMWGVNMRIGLGEQGTGAPSAPAKPAEPKVVVVQKPPASLVELHDEGDHLNVLIERPGLDLSEVEWELDDDLLWLTIGHEQQELFLPRPMHKVYARQAQGVIELRLEPEETP